MGIALKGFKSFLSPKDLEILGRPARIKLLEWPAEIYYFFTRLHLTGPQPSKNQAYLTGEAADMKSHSARWNPTIPLPKDNQPVRTMNELELANQRVVSRARGLLSPASGTVLFFSSG